MILSQIDLLLSENILCPIPAEICPNNFPNLHLTNYGQFYWHKLSIIQLKHLCVGLSVGLQQTLCKHLKNWNSLKQIQINNLGATTISPFSWPFNSSFFLSFSSKGRRWRPSWHGSWETLSQYIFIKAKFSINIFKIQHLCPTFSYE